MNRIWSAFFTLLLASVSLGSCVESETSASDEALMLLLGDSVPGVHGDVARISERTARCIKVFADRPLDASEQLTGESLLIENENCIRKLRLALTEPGRNIAVLVLDNFKDAALADRVAALASAGRTLDLEPYLPSSSAYTRATGAQSNSVTIVLKRETSPEQTK
ncbi:MAG: hypothetical protein NXH87_18035 [Rhodobiaceae bacterium]|nr:hypothetical protein [Rhodobiaceae bacterium]